MKKIITAFILFSLSTYNGLAEETPVEAWYEALQDVNRETFKKIISDDARIILKEIQVIQSKDEFIESLDNWEDAAKGLSLFFSADRKGENEIVTQVCYQFESNAFTNLETFTFENGKIVLQVQEKLRDGC